MSKAVIVGRPINGISINGLEYLLDNEDQTMIFENEDAAKDYLRQHNFTEEEIEEAVVFKHSIGTCKRCGSPLFPSQITDYTSQCFTCDEDFYSFEQETEQTEPDVPKCIGMTRPEFAKFLYEICQVGDSVTIYEDFNPEGNDPSFAYELQKIQFADSDMIIGNYWGGGSPFVDDITGDPDSTGLEAVLNLWFDEHEFTETIWVERTAVTG